MEEDNSEELKIPKRLNQEHKYEEYSIDTCSKDQKEVLSYILQHLKTWNKLAKMPELQEIFKPLRMTLSGVAGSGKSTLINALVTAIRKITGKTNSVYVVGPTGSAAFNAGGVTCHRLFNINGTPKIFELSGQTLRTLLSKLESTVALIVDERSMVSSLLLGTMEAYCRQAAFKGTKCHLRWGGLPIVILVGDDHQLPPIQEGVFHCFEEQIRQQRSKVEDLYVQNSMELFKEFGKDVMTLAASKRVLEGQVQLQRILNGVRGESNETLSMQDAEFLCSFHIDNKEHFNQQDKQQIKKDALYLFANVEPKNEYN
jgi:energy-coupling factor transporter ATP-binding protein EcfA2